MKTITHVLPAETKTSSVLKQLLEDKRLRREHYAKQGKATPNDSKQPVCA